MTIREEANALTCCAFRNGYIEKLHAGKHSALLETPGLSRIAGGRANELSANCTPPGSRRVGVKPALIRFGAEVEAILRRRPQSGALFPYLRTVRAGDRATEFRQRVMGLGIKGVTLHSYRYAWAERALKCGYPERFAQQALGHNSKAVHHAYSKHAEVTVPCLDDWEKGWNENLKAETLKPEMPELQVLPVDFRALPVAARASGTDAALLAVAQTN